MTLEQLRVRVVGIVELARYDDIPSHLESYRQTEVLYL